MGQLTQKKKEWIQEDSSEATELVLARDDGILI